MAIGACRVGCSRQALFFFEGGEGLFKLRLLGWSVGLGYDDGMIDFMGVTTHLSCISGLPYDVVCVFQNEEGGGVDLSGVTLAGAVTVNGVAQEIEVEAGGEENEVVLHVPGLPEGRWVYYVLATGDDGESSVIFSGNVNVVESGVVLAGAELGSEASRRLLVRMPGAAGERLRLEWLASTVSELHAEEAGLKASAAATSAAKAAGSAVEAKDAAALSAESADQAATSADEAEAQAVRAEEAAREVANAAVAVEWARDEAVESVNDAKGGAVAAVESVRDGALEGIEGARDEAVSAVESQEESSVAAVRAAGAEGVEMAGLAEQYAGQAYNSAQSAASLDAHALESAQRAEAAAALSAESADQAATSAAKAAGSAVEAKDASEVANAAVAALEAMPEIDTSGNMTLAGGLTAGGAINANGGINKPLTVLPTTAQSVLNRSDAFGAYCVQLAHSAPALITSVTSAGLTVKTEVPGQLHRFTATSQTEPKSGKITTTHELLSRGNYCRTKGFTIPLRAGIYKAGCAAKITFGIGLFNNVTEKVDADLDSFRFSPKAGTAWDQYTEKMRRIIDVTFYYDDVENSNDVYKIRVRELRYINNLGKWVVNETITRISSFNTSINEVHNLTFHMNGKVASLWAVVNGYWSVSTVWLADLTPPSDLFDTNLLSTNLYVDLLGGTFLIGNPILFIPPGNGQQNGAYNAFKSIEYRNLISETTYDFTPYELEES